MIILVVSMHFVKIQVPEPFASVLQASLVIHLLDVMTILVQLILVEPMLIVNHQEQELYVNAERVMKEILLSNVL